MSEINKDIECLKYCIKHLGVGGSTERLARMAKIGYIVLIISIILLILIFIGK